jgi:CheY-like chemotaxis protein
VAEEAPERRASAAPELADTRRRRSEDAPPPNPEGVREDQWVYLFDKQQRGPLDLDYLIDLVLTLAFRGHGGSGCATDHRQDDPEIAGRSRPRCPFRPARAKRTSRTSNNVPEALVTALIADEDEGFRKLLALPLAAQGFRIFEAADGEEAWRLASENRPWIMLADLELPEIDGFEFCRRVRANSLLSHTPFVFISGSDKFKDRAQAQQVGSDDFLSKQTPIRELLIRIQLLLNRYSNLSGTEGQQTGAAGLLEGQPRCSALRACSRSATRAGHGHLHRPVKEPTPRRRR